VSYIPASTHIKRFLNDLLYDHPVRDINRKRTYCGIRHVLEEVTTDALKSLFVEVWQSRRSATFRGLQSNLCAEIAGSAGGRHILSIAVLSNIGILRIDR
jgi:hypothetical protein